MTTSKQSQDGTQSILTLLGSSHQNIVMTQPQRHRAPPDCYTTLLNIGRPRYFPNTTQVISLKRLNTLKVPTGTWVPEVSGLIIRANVRMEKNLRSSKITSAQIASHVPLMVTGRRNHFKSSMSEAPAIFLCTARKLLGYCIQLDHGRPLPDPGLPTNHGTKWHFQLK
jgi:hypothetical protein